MADAYSEKGLRLVHSWYEGGMQVVDEQILTWQAFATYCDESYLVIDSVDSWRRKAAGRLNLKELVGAVNEVSSQKIEAA